MSQRILSGKWRGQILAGGISPKTRPTTSLMRQAIFNIWSDRIEGARFLDLFSGTGALGFEALSAGACHVTCVEKERSALLSIRKSCEKFASQLEDGLTSEMFILRAQDVERFLATPNPQVFDLIYVDPPYDWAPHKKALPGHYVAWLLEQVGRFTRAGSRLMIEQGRYVKENIPQQHGRFRHIESRQYGDSIIHHFEAFDAQSTGLIQDPL